MSAKKKKRAGRFLFGLRVYLAVIVFICGLALIALWVALTRHQQAVDAEKALKAEQARQAAYELSVKRAPQRAFEDFMATAEASTWADSWFAAHSDTFDDPAQVREKLTALFSDPALQCWKAGDYSESRPRYLIRGGERDLAFVTLSGAALDWSVSEIEVVVEEPETATLLVPAGYTVRCNGAVLSPESAEAEIRLYDMAEYAELLVNPMRWETYTVSGLLSRPVLTAEPPEGAVLSMAEDGTVFYALPEDEAARYRQRAENFIYDLLRYYMLGNSNTWGNMWAALDHVMDGSQAFRLIRNSYDGVTWDTCYGNASYSASAGEVRVLADNCLMVDVVYHAEGSSQGYTNVASGTYRVYFLDLGGGYGIFGLAYV